MGALISINLFLFQNCSNYSATLTKAEKSSLKSDLQQLADNSPALNDNVPINIDPVTPDPSDLLPSDEMVNIPPSTPTTVGNANDVVNDEVSSIPEADTAVDPGETDQDEENKDCDNRHHGKDPKCDNKDDHRGHTNLCGKLAMAGEQLKGFNIINLTSADSGKSFDNHGKTMYVYTGETPLNIQFISSSGKTVICGNILIENLDINGNCHLINAQAQSAEVNGNLTTSVLDENGIDKPIDSKRGKDVKSCHVGTDSIIQSNE